MSSRNYHQWGIFDEPCSISLFTCKTQTLHLKRISYEDEIKAATAKEYARRQATAKKGAANFAMDIQDVRTTASEIGGRLSRLEDMIHKLVSSLQHPSPQHHVPSVPLGGRAPHEDSVMNELANDVAGEDGSALDTVEHGQNSGMEAENVEGDVQEDGDVDLDFLVDAISDVPADTVLASKLASVAPVQDVPPDAVEAATELKDPYTFVAEEVTANDGASEGHMSTESWQGR